MEKRYSISDAARQVGVEAHVLRYWEEELGFEIPRNSQGHRYYRESDISFLRQIKDLKEQGFQLRAIKILMPDMRKVEHMSGQELYSLREELNQRVQMEEEQKTNRARMGRVMPMPTNRTTESALQHTSHHNVKLEQFEALLRNMICDTLQEQQEASEQRISEAVSERMIKEMDYLMREKEDAQESFQEKQIELLQQILAELRPVEKEAAASEESGVVSSKRKNKKSGDKPKRFRFGF